LKKIGLTGGIGSGKSYIASIFEALGVPVFYADDEAKKILNNPDVLEQINRQLSVDVIDHSTGLADKKLIASIVFQQPEKLALLNNIIHPKVEEWFQRWCQKYSHKKYVLKEAAILFESGSYKNLDGIIAVVAPMTVRINRVMKRDGQSVEQIRQRINNQWTDEQRTAHANWIIDNDENKELLSKILEIDHHLNTN
jgi:dephospho-CoA kinase